MGAFLELLLDVVAALLLPAGKKQRGGARGGKKTGQASVPNGGIIVPEGGTAIPKGDTAIPEGGAGAFMSQRGAYFLPEDFMLPAFSYAPQQDGNADPGEVVWAWVPFEDDASQGKDRPVLVLAQVQGGLVCAQLTSKDHEDFKETRWGRRWMDIGTGEWDRRRRPSEVRLDRFVFVPADSVRREGGRVSKEVFNQVTTAIQALR